MKNDRLKDKDRKKEIEDLVGPLAEERFALLVNLGKKITDFQTKSSTTGTSGMEEDNLAETHGINVQFDEQSDEDDDENVYGEINDEDEEDEGEEAQDSSAIQAQKVRYRNNLHVFCMQYYFRKRIYFLDNSGSNIKF